MTDLVYKEICCCGGSIEITTQIPDRLFERKDRINEFVNKHRKCPEVWAGSFLSMPTSLEFRPVDPDEELNSMELAIFEQILRGTALTDNPNKSVRDIVTRMKNAGFKLTRMY